MSTPPVVSTIAGFDPSSGAGITADLKTISSLGCYGVACITALTVQNTLGVRRVEAVSPKTVLEILQSLFEDFPPSAIKIGMLATAGIVTAVADFLETLPQPRCPIVLDPILRSSSGAELLDQAGTHFLRARLLPLATVVTPNRQEAAVLTALPADDPEALARALRQLGPVAAVVTGGDATGNDSDDVLAYTLRGVEFLETLSAPRIHSRSTHGTGCAFSTAIACALAQALAAGAASAAHPTTNSSPSPESAIPAAVTSAKLFVRRAIERAPGLGHGVGPMGLDRASY